jgi:hypothetical protein
MTSPIRPRLPFLHVILFMGPAFVFRIFFFFRRYRTSNWWPIRYLRNIIHAGKIARVGHGLRGQIGCSTTRNLWVSDWLRSTRIGTHGLCTFLPLAWCPFPPVEQLTQLIIEHIQYEDNWSHKITSTLVPSQTTKAIRCTLEASTYGSTICPIHPKIS